MASSIGKDGKKMTFQQFRTLQGGRNVMQNEGSNICKYLFFILH